MSLQEEYHIKARALTKCKRGLKDVESQGLKGEQEASYSEWQSLHPDCRPVSGIVTRSVQHLQLLP